MTAEKSKRGGARPGAGRKPGAINRATAEARARAEAGGILPLDFMLNRMRDESAPMADRQDMAKAAAPFIHAKLSAVEVGGPNGGPVPVSVIERRIVRPDASNG